MFLRNSTHSFMLLTAVLATAQALALSQKPISNESILKLSLGGASAEVLLAYVKAAASVTPLSSDDALALQNEGVPDSVVTAYLARQAEDRLLPSVPSPLRPAPTRMLRVTGQLERVPNLSRKWEENTKEPHRFGSGRRDDTSQARREGRRGAQLLPWYKDPFVQGIVLLFASRVSDAGSNNLPVGAQQPVCWCAQGNGCTSLRVLSVQGDCGRLETPGDGKWDRHFSSSEWKTLRYADTFIALNLDLPPTAKAVELSILANRCSDTGSYMFPIPSTHTDMSPGSPAPFYLSFSPHGSKDFSASIELRLLTDGEGAFDVELKNVKMDDRDSESAALMEKCIHEHGGAQCHYVSLEQDLDGLQAGAGTSDSTRCQ